MSPELESLARAFAKLVAEHLSAKTQESTFVDLRTLPDALRRKAYEAARAGELEANKIGKRWYAKPEVLEAWVQGEKPRDETSAERIRRWAGV